MQSAHPVAHSTPSVSSRRLSSASDSYLEWLDELDAAVVDNRLGSGCFVDQSFPVVIYLLLKYHRRPEQGLIANTNLGGNNAARGAVLGALLGAANGFEALPKRWVDGLRHSPQEIEAFV